MFRAHSRMNRGGFDRCRRANVPAAPSGARGLALVISHAHLCSFINISGRQAWAANMRPVNRKGRHQSPDAQLLQAPKDGGARAAEQFKVLFVSLCANEGTLSCICGACRVFGRAVSQPVTSLARTMPASALGYRAIRLRNMSVGHAAERAARRLQPSVLRVAGAAQAAASREGAWPAPCDTFRAATALS